MIESHGRLGIDYAVRDHLALLEPVLALAQHQVAASLKAGDDVVLDHGLGTRAERDQYKQLAESHLASWQLVCFDVDLETLRDRCRARRVDAQTVPIVFGLLRRRWHGR